MKSKPTIYYWLPVIVLFGMLCILAVVVLIGIPRISDAIPNSVIADIIWTSTLENSLKSLGIGVQEVKILGSLQDQRQLQISITNLIADQEQQPYFLVSGIHITTGVGLYLTEPRPRRIDSILVNVLDQSGEFLYSVTLSEPDLEAVFLQQISEQEYLQRWIISGDAPELFFNPN